MKKWMVAIMVGGLVVSSATMAFAAEDQALVSESGRDLSGKGPGIQRVRKNQGRLDQKLSGLFEIYLPDQVDEYEAMKEDGKAIRSHAKELKGQQKALHGEEFEASRDEGKALAEEWKAKVEADQATKEEARHALDEFRKGQIDEIVGIDEETRADLDDIQDQMKVLREEGRELGKTLKAAVEADDEVAIQEALQRILEKMEASQAVRQERLDLIEAIEL